MGKGKLILICQSGGEFITKVDGIMSYEGGEANAVIIYHETLFDDLKLKLAEMYNLDQKTVSIKYFLPGNKRNLITLRNDKDLKRMYDFHVNSVTVDIFIDGKQGFDRDAMKKQSSRYTGVKLAETVAPSIAATRLSRDTASEDTHSPDNTPYNTSPSQTSSGSLASSVNASDSDSEYNIRITGTLQSQACFDTNGSPASTVKKRRRTASWKIGANDNDGDGKRRKKTRKVHDCLAANDNLEHQTDDLLGTDVLGSPINVALCDSDLPENLIASWKNCITGVGQEFKNVKEFREALQKYATAHRFGFRFKKNDPNRASVICVEEGCPWSIHASWIPASKSFRIKKLNNSHTCNLEESWKKAHPAKKVFVNVIKNKLRDSPNEKPKEIVKSISRDFGIDLKYTHIRLGMQDARDQLQGPYKAAYNHLPWFCEKLVEKNPGSYVKLVTNDEKQLQYFFISFLSCIHGFQNGCRPILFLNATSLKSKYHESLLTATAIDANDGFFPVAFCIVNNEHDDSWHWFLEQLKSAMSSTRTLTFVSDMEKGIEKSVHEVFENAHHSYSMFHLLESFKRNLKGPFHGEGRTILPVRFLAAAHAVRLGGFKKFTEQIKEISSSAYDWVIQIEPENWTSLLFKGEPYNHILENIAEPYAKHIDEIKKSTIMQKIEALLQMVSDIITNRRTELTQWATKLVPSKERLIQEAAFKGHGLRVFVSTETLFEVHGDSTHVVDTEKCECSCLEWKESGLPCCHAIAALISSEKSFYDYCSKYFTVESYRLTYPDSIEPVSGIDEALGKEEIGSGDVQVLPPAPSSNQHKKEKVKTNESNKRSVTCSKCKGIGHNKASCKATD